jgi:hypothetical protein
VNLAADALMSSVNFEDYVFGSESTNEDFPRCLLCIHLIDELPYAAAQLPDSRCHEIARKIDGVGTRVHAWLIDELLHTEKNVHRRRIWWSLRPFLAPTLDKGLYSEPGASHSAKFGQLDLCTVQGTRFVSPALPPSPSLLNLRSRNYLMEPYLFRTASLSGAKWLLPHCLARFASKGPLTRSRTPSHGNPALQPQGGQNKTVSQIVQGAS